MSGHFNQQKEEQEQDGTEYLLGSVFRKDLAEEMNTLSFEEVKEYLPDGEVQQGVDDTMDCASRSPVNDIALKFNYLIATGKLTPEEIKWFTNTGYIVGGRFDASDAFIAIKSGTTRDGNSLKAPLQAIHEHGLIPKQMLPLESWMTFEDYHDPKRITGKMEKLGLEFIKRFPIFYEKVSDYSVNESLCVAGYAWPSPINGIYPRVENAFNHAFDRLRPMHKIFDNYYDVVDGDFIKDLAPDYKLYPYGYRIIITRGTIQTNWLLDLWQRILSLFI